MCHGGRQSSIVVKYTNSGLREEVREEQGQRGLGCRTGSR